MRQTEAFKKGAAAVYVSVALDYFPADCDFGKFGVVPAELGMVIPGDAGQAPYLVFSVAGQLQVNLDSAKNMFRCNFNNQQIPFGEATLSVTWLADHKNAFQSKYAVKIQSSVFQNIHSNFKGDGLEIDGIRIPIAAGCDGAAISPIGFGLTFGNKLSASFLEAETSSSGTRVVRCSRTATALTLFPHV